MFCKSLFSRQLIYLKIRLKEENIKGDVKIIIFILVNWISFFFFSQTPCLLIYGMCSVVNRVRDKTATG